MPCSEVAGEPTRCGKGQKDRRIVLPSTLVEKLRSHHVLNRGGLGVRSPLDR
jgi:hypothetical protein